MGNRGGRIVCKHKDTTEAELVIVRGRSAAGFTVIREAILYSNCNRCGADLSEYVSGGYLLPIRKG